MDRTAVALVDVTTTGSTGAAAVAIKTALAAFDQPRYEMRAEWPLAG